MDSDAIFVLPFRFFDVVINRGLTDPQESGYFPFRETVTVVTNDSLLSGWVWCPRVTVDHY